MLNKSINLIMYVFITQLSKKFCIMCEIFLFVLFFRIMYSLVIKKVLHCMRDIFMLLFLSNYVHIYQLSKKVLQIMCELFLFVFFNAKGVKIHSTKFSASTQNGHIIFSPKINGGKNFIFKFRFTNLGAANCIQICSISFLKI